LGLVLEMTQGKKKGQAETLGKKGNWETYPVLSIKEKEEEIRSMMEKALWAVKVRGLKEKKHQTVWSEIILGWGVPQP